MNSILGSVVPLAIIMRIEGKTTNTFRIICVHVKRHVP